MNAQVLYRQIADYYREAIRAGELKPGDRLPPYVAMLEKWNVSTSTIRAAITALKREGLVSGDTGGTFVSDLAAIELDWDSVKDLAHALHDEIETAFTPDVVLTMSGPGGFAAFMAMAYSIRLVPTIAAVTFPIRDERTRNEDLYRGAAKLDTWKILETGKWTVYLPRTLAKYPTGSRILIFDDRVLSGTTQKLARDHLETIGMEVRTAALVVSTNNVMNVDYYGTVIDDRFQMPWGTDRGRT